MNKCFFFDRDGIVNVLLDNAYVRKIDEFIFIEEFFEIFKYVKSKNYLAIVITNQQGIGKGLMTDDDLQNIHHWMQEVIYKRTNFKFDDIFYCGELDSARSFRRKPAPGMFYEAIEKWNIDTKNSFMLGDSFRDSISSNAAGIKSILIGNFNQDQADYVFPSLKDFLKVIEKIVS